MIITKVKLLLLCALVFLVSCTVVMPCKGQSLRVNRQETPIEKFPQFIKVNFVKVSAYTFYEPLEMHIKDDFIICQNTDTPENGYWFNILNKQGKVVDRKFKKGKGPNEVLKAGSSGFDNNRFWHFDRGLRKFWVVNSVLQDTPNPKSNSIDLMVGRARYYNDSTIITRGGTGTSYKYDLYDFKNKKIIGGYGDLSTLSKLDVFDNGWNPQMEKEYFEGDFKFKPDKTKFVVGYYYFDVIEIYHAKGDLIKAIRGPLRLSPEFRLFATKEYAGFDKHPQTIVAYTYIQCTDKYIYAAFSGNQLHGGSPFHPKKKYVFNWNGDSIAILQLNHPVMSFVIDEKDNTIYSVSDSTGDFIKATFSIE